VASAAALDSPILFDCSTECRFRLVSLSNKPFLFMRGEVKMAFKTLLVASRFTRKVCGLALVFAACPTMVYAQIAPSPEIDPGSIGNALALLTGGFLMLMDWRGKRSRS
jgi:hypothetical protein